MRTPPNLQHRTLTHLTDHPAKTWLKRFLGAAALAASCGSLADWQLDNAASQLNFVSVKATDIAEVHKFTEVSGTIRDGGKTTGEIDLSVELASVDTLIPLRDSRMRELLFETVTFPTAKLYGNLPLADFLTLGVGDSKTADITLTLDLHGAKAPVTANVLVSRLSPSRMLVTAKQPVVLQAQTFSLVKGIEALREAAGLPSISKSIPVSFVFTFVDAA